MCCLILKGGFITEEEVFNICGIIETNGHEIRRANGFSAKGQIISN